MTKNFSPPIYWQCIAFEQLSLDTWYDISHAREQVFIVEQHCPYLDLDGQDRQAWHILGMADGKLACYARILPPSLHFTQGEFAKQKMPAIGRVLTVAEYRGNGLANELMTFAIAQTLEKFGTTPIYISAQVYLLAFYERLGFIAQGDSYFEDGIPHQDMIKV